jgi:hypothetical protein
MLHSLAKILSEFPIILNDVYTPKLLDLRKEAKFQWLQDPSKIKGDNLNNIRCEANLRFTNKKNEYLKDRINELAMNSKNKTRGIN